MATSTHELRNGPKEGLGTRTAHHRLRDSILIIAVLAGAATALIFGLRYEASELQRETDRWATRLDTAVVAGARGIGKRVENKSADLLELADKAALRLYLWTLVNRVQMPSQGNAPVDATVPSAEREYLTSLLLAHTDAGTRSPARNSGFNALSLLDPSLQTIVSTPIAAPTQKALQIARQAIDTRTRQLVLARDADGRAMLYMAVIVEPPPGAAGGLAIGGVLIAATNAADLLRPVTDGLPGYFDNDANLLLASSGDPVVVLNGAPPLLAVTSAVEPGFSVGETATGSTALQSSQRVPGTGWTLLRRVDGDQALLPLRQRIWANFAALALSVVLLGALLYAWREHRTRVEQAEELLPMVIGHDQGSRGPATREERMLNKLVASLVDIIDLHDPYSAFHSARLAELCRAIGNEMGLDQESLSYLVQAAMLANVGKISLPRELLTKRDELSEEEHELLQTHVEEGVEILRKLDFDDPILSAIAQKQEHLDGTGYPEGLAADRITLPGRILAVANAYIALVSPRAYRDAIHADEALAIIERSVGAEYDRQAFAALQKVIASGEGLSDWDLGDG